MTEDIVVPEVETTEETPTAEVVKTEKTFTESDVQRVVKERVAREKGVATKVQKEFDEYKTSAEEEIKSLKDTVLSLIKKDLESIPEETKALLEKLDLKDQVEWLSKHTAEVKKTLPKLPQAAGDKPENKSPRKKYF